MIAVDGVLHFLAQSDAIGRAVALALLLMSISAWVVIAWKALVLRRALRDLARGVPAFWEAATLQDGQRRLLALDRERVLSPLVEAALAADGARTLASRGRAESQRTRRLRGALQRSVAHLQTGQVVLASVGSTAPFVGLFGTVWGIYHALVAIGNASQFSLDKVAGPVGEALVMTAAGLAVAIPAVLGYNLYGQWIGRCEAALEGFAHDLRELLDEPPAPRDDVTGAG